MKRVSLLVLLLIMLFSCAINVINPKVIIQETSPGIYEYSIINKHGERILSETAYRLEPTYKYVSD